MNGHEKRILNQLDGKTLIIGREGHVYVNDPSVSKQHAEISISGGKIRLRDLESTNGTYIFRHQAPIPLTDEYVELNQSIMFGRHIQKVRSLLDSVRSISKLAG